MKSKLCSVLVVLSIAVLSATAVHADEPDAVGAEETVSETGEPADPMTAQLQSEVLRYYRGIGVDPTEAELKSGFRAASEMVLADVAIEQISLAIDEAIKRHEKGEDVPFELAIPRFVRALAEEEARSIQGDASEAAQQRRTRRTAGGPLSLRSSPHTGWLRRQEPRRARIPCSLRHRSREDGKALLENVTLLGSSTPQHFPPTLFHLQSHCVEKSRKLPLWC